MSSVILLVSVVLKGSSSARASRVEFELGASETSASFAITGSFVAVPFGALVASFGALVVTAFGALGFDLSFNSLAPLRAIFEAILPFMGGTDTAMEISTRRTAKRAREKYFLGKNVSAVVSTYQFINHYALCKNRFGVMTLVNSLVHPFCYN